MNVCFIDFLTLYIDYFTETKKFYLALNAVGTDFSLMVKLFPGRTRTELKRKWQKEEKTSRHLLDKAISKNIPQDLTPIVQILFVNLRDFLSFIFLQIS